MIKQALPLIVALLLSVAATNSTEAEEARSLRLVTHVFPPFQYKANGVITGSMISVMQAICHKVKVPCTITMSSFQNSLALATSGEADIMFTVSSIGSTSGIRT